MLIGTSYIWEDWRNVGSDEGSELGLWVGKVIGGTLRSVERPPVDIYYGIEEKIPIYNIILKIKQRFDQ